MESIISRQCLPLISSRAAPYANPLCSRLNVGFCPVATGTPNWKAQVSRAERFHIIGVWAAVLAFACFLTAVAFTVAVQ